MATNSIKLDQYVSLPILERAIEAMINGQMTPQYAHELGLTTGFSKERSRKAGYTLRCVTLQNPVFEWLMNHKAEYSQYIKNSSDKALIIAAILSGGYSVVYNLLQFSGKYLHTEDTVKGLYIKKKLSEIYGSNVNFEKTVQSAFRMLVDCGLLQRVAPGVYKKGDVAEISDFTRQLYRQSFLIHNPYLSESDNLETNPYFELIN